MIIGVCDTARSHCKVKVTWGRKKTENIKKKARNGKEEEVKRYEMR